MRYKSPKLGNYNENLKRVSRESSRRSLAFEMANGFSSRSRTPVQVQTRSWNILMVNEGESVRRFDATLGRTSVRPLMTSKFVGQDTSLFCEVSSRTTLVYEKGRCR